ncbi:S8 family serine peptidase [Lachnospiraceae bacterium WCA-9-b2]|uniref:S8 family serine peptidase n=3 Tax=Sporofaciens musculi TaxID=2681861 RepID=A0A7X3MJJ6_9FIRM|nr:S8 family peptidase [Sporofaciens musculi]MXP77586.1 S8 family serine peptidase [Sporofaciens musculi]
MDRETCRRMIMSEDFIDFIAPIYREITSEEAERARACVQSMDFGFQAIYVDKTLTDPVSLEYYRYNSIPNCYQLMDLEAMDEAGISVVQSYPTLNLQGNGVMVGILDTGIDYRNPLFQNIDGSTRIAGIWDQTIQDGPFPEGLDYGSEYTEEMINEALRSQNPLEVVPSMDTDGHGTFIASVAAGNADLEHRFIGAAPEATLAVVKLKPAKAYLKDFYVIRQDAKCFQENDIMLAMKYINDLARKRNMPLVLCIALGTNLGGHNGTSLLSNMLDAYSSVLNRSVVISAGNGAVHRHHFSRQLGSMDETVDAEIRVEEGVEGFVAELWTTVPNVMTVAFTSPSGERTGYITLKQGREYRETFVFDKTDVEVEYRLLLENNDSQLIFMRIRNPASGIWKISVKPVRRSDGMFHIWLPVQEFLTGEVYFLEANPDTTLAEPGSSLVAMTVAFYNGVDKSVDINSGRGYTRDGRVKPDYAVPGVLVSGAGLNNEFVVRSGSSVAAGIATGAAALLMEWVLNNTEAWGVNSSQIRNIILLGAEQRPGMESPNREWGYGAMNLYRSLDILRQL